MLTLSNEWFASESGTGNRTIITRGRLLLENFMSSGQYSTRVEISWSYAPQSRSMPPEDEAGQIDLITGYLSEAMEADRLAVLTAVHTGAGHAVSVYYTRDLQAFSKRVDRLLSTFPPLPITIGAVQDAEWMAYTQMKEQIGL